MTGAFVFLSSEIVGIDMVKGCVHIHVKDGNIQSVFCHLSDLPENGVIHMTPDQVLTEKEFLRSHPMDKNELYVEAEGEMYDLGGNSI